MGWVDKTWRSTVSLYRDSPERQHAAKLIPWLAQEEKECGAEFATYERQQQAKIRENMGNNCLGCGERK